MSQAGFEVLKGTRKCFDEGLTIVGYSLGGLVRHPEEKRQQRNANNAYNGIEEEQDFKRKWLDQNEQQDDGPENCQGIAQIHQQKRK
jgi:hypothetical protein